MADGGAVSPAQLSSTDELVTRSLNRPLCWTYEHHAGCFVSPAVGRRAEVWAGIQPWQRSQSCFWRACREQCSNFGLFAGVFHSLKGIDRHADSENKILEVLCRSGLQPLTSA